MRHGRTALNASGRLQGRLDEMAAWAKRSAADVVLRDAIIRDLQRQLGEQTTWAQQAAADVEQRDQTIRALQAQLAEQTDWAQQTAATVAEQQALLSEQGAQQTEHEVVADPPPTEATEPRAGARGVRRWLPSLFRPAE